MQGKIPRFLTRKALIKNKFYNANHGETLNRLHGICTILVAYKKLTLCKLYRFYSLCACSVPARLGKGQGAKEIGHNLAREQPKFGHNLLRKRHKIGHTFTRERPKFGLVGD